MTANLKLLNRAAEQFLLRLLPVDKAQVGAFNDKIQLSGTFTNNRDELIGALNDLDFGNPTRPERRRLAPSLDALKGIDGRRVVLVFTDGDDTVSRHGFGTVLERARAEEVMVYAIGLESEYFNGMRVRAIASRRRGLRKIADETGGGYFELEKTTRPGADLHAGRAGAAQPVPDRVRARRARRQGAQARRAGEAAGDDGPRAQELPGGAGQVVRGDEARRVLERGGWRIARPGWPRSS